MDNYAIADQFSLLAKLMDIHGDNPFKAKSYASAAFTLEKLPMPVADLPAAQLFKIRGIGESVGNKVIEIIGTGELQALQELIQSTPAGVLEMLNIKGIGPKKIHVLWKEMKIDSVEELEKACVKTALHKRKALVTKPNKRSWSPLNLPKEARDSSSTSRWKALPWHSKANWKQNFQNNPCN